MSTNSNGDDGSRGISIDLDQENLPLSAAFNTHFHTQTPRAKTALLNNGSKKDAALLDSKDVSLQNKRSHPTSSPEQMSPVKTTPRSPLKTVLSTPQQSSHPALRDITNSTQVLRNPPDLFLQPAQKRRSLRRSTIDDSQTLQQHPVPAGSKLAKTVFPAASEENSKSSVVVLNLESSFTAVEDTDDLRRPVENAASLLGNEFDSIDCLSGPSKVIPGLDLGECLDFTSLKPIADGEEMIKVNAEVRDKLVFEEAIGVIEAIEANFTTETDDHAEIVVKTCLNE